jgi:transposase
MGHRRGESRQQAALFPVLLDELVGEHALARVVDAWVEALNLKALGFAKAQAQVMGAPPYDPADLLKLYIWGYLSAVRSSRALERECQRNVECMWLLGRLVPDHKTIAEFRRCNCQALIAVCAVFVQFARSQRLIAGSIVAVDGSKIRAVASRKAIARQTDLAAQAQRNAQKIERYLKLLDSQDSQEGGHSCKAGDVQQALRHLHAQRAAIQGDLERLAQSGSSMVVQTEREVQVMHSLYGAPGYNLQTAVEAQSHLIVHHEVSAEANDQRQLQPMAEAASQVLDTPCTVVADAGYANGEQIAALGDQGVTTFVAPNRSGNRQADGTLYDRNLFKYDASSDSFTCPTGKLLKRKQLSRKDKMVIYAADRQDCASCPVKQQCTEASQRFVSRHLYDEALQANARRLEQRPAMMLLRRQTVEHPFGTIKHQILGNARLLVRGMKGAQAELSLAVLAYNLKRVFNMKGANWMHRALQG